VFAFWLTPEDNDRLRKIEACFQEELRQAILRFYANDARSRPTDFAGIPPLDLTEVRPVRSGEIDGTE
jgi:hypothetical protein